MAFRNICLTFCSLVPSLIFAQISFTKQTHLLSPEKHYSGVAIAVAVAVLVAVGMGVGVGVTVGVAVPEPATLGYLLLGGLLLRWRRRAEAA